MTADIFKYLEGELNDEQSKAFEKEMDNNKELREDVELCKDVDVFLEKKAEFEKLRQQVIQMHDNHEKEFGGKSIRLKYLKYSAVAASVVLIIGTIWFLTLFNNSTDSLYKQNFTAWQPKNITRGLNANETLLKWYELYSISDYYAVAETYKMLRESDMSNPQIALMYSCALMQQNNFEKAVEVLNSIDVTNSALLKAEYNWYTGLCYLKLDDSDNAQTFLKKLAGNKKYGEAASALLSEIEDE